MRALLLEDVVFEHRTVMVRLRGREAETEFRPNSPTSASPRVRQQCGAPSYNKAGKLLAEDAIQPCSRACVCTKYDGEKAIVAALLWALEGVKRASKEDMEEQAQAIAQSKSTRRAVRGEALRCS